MTTKPQIAFFDFDGTLIANDSFMLILKASIRQQPWRLALFFLFSPILFATLIFKLEKSLAKSTLLWSTTVLRGKINSIKFLKNTISEKSKEIWFNDAVEQFEKLRQENVEVVIISASGALWIRAILKDKFKHTKVIIGSRLQFFLGGVILKSKNCYEEEKLNRIQECLGDKFVWHSAWSDHIADLPMLKKAPLRYIICPKKKHIQIFDRELEKNYILLNWKTKK